MTALAKVLLSETLTAVILHLLPLLERPELTYRIGVIEALSCLATSLAVEIIPYIVLLVVPVLGRMSDSNQEVRLAATFTFATLVKLMPLGEGIPDPVDMPESLRTKKQDEKNFLNQLLNSKEADKYELKVPIMAELRSYQEAGINWLGFLHKYKLHGILCDDMGLGKTLQTICLLANHHETSRAQGGQICQSLVVCPTTLGGHWKEEINRFVTSKFLNPFLYIGNLSSRLLLRSEIPKHNVIITSYDIVRNDIEFFSTIQWEYLILDEGHVIKNTKSKTSMAVRKLSSKHRLILSGTPIQNSKSDFYNLCWIIGIKFGGGKDEVPILKRTKKEVGIMIPDITLNLEAVSWKNENEMKLSSCIHGVIELWSLFDFLMPGYLGTEKQFMHRYARPILNSKESKCSIKDQEVGVLAMEALHRQTLPFILRRVKEDVLKDLPPKITQDYYCDLSPIQTSLYEDFDKSMLREGDEMRSSSSDDSQSKKSLHPNVFKAMQYLKKVCNHPKLVLSQEHPLYPALVTSNLEADQDASGYLKDIGKFGQL